MAEPYDCARDCQRVGGEWDDEMRSARGCRLPGLHPVHARPTFEALYQVRHGDSYLGRYPDKRLAGTRVLGVPQRWEKPFEDPETGCPGAYYRTPYIDSLDKYCRRRTEGGGRVPNPLFDAADWQIQRAVMLLEEEQERAIAHITRISNDRMAAQQEQAAREQRDLRGRRR